MEGVERPPATPTRGSSDAEARLLATSWDADPQGGGKPVPILWAQQGAPPRGTRQAQGATPHPLLFSWHRGWAGTGDGHSARVWQALAGQCSAVS